MLLLWNDNHQSRFAAHVTDSLLLDVLKRDATLWTQHTQRYTGSPARFVPVHRPFIVTGTDRIVRWGN